MKVIYNDPRRFGFFKFIENKQELINRFSHLGPEPFFKNFNLKYLLKYFFNKKKDIKSFLIDQKFVSGIGNIYASEILFLFLMISLFICSLCNFLANDCLLICPTGNSDIWLSNNTK